MIAGCVVLALFVAFIGAAVVVKLVIPHFQEQALIKRESHRIAQACEAAVEDVWRLGIAIDGKGRVWHTYQIGFPGQNGDARHAQVADSNGRVVCIP